MDSFNCLDPATDLYSHTLVEASAGTGKTFAIEHMVTRFVLDGVSIESILVVTFTIAATKELKQRIHQCLIHSMHAIEENKPGSLAYLEFVCKKSDQEQFKACLLLEKAVLDIERANICTIHSFCFKSLDKQGLVPMQEEGKENFDYKAFYLQKIKQTLNKVPPKNALLTSSLSRLVRGYQFSFDKLYNALIEHLSSGSFPRDTPSICKEKVHIEQHIKKIKQLISPSIENKLALFKGFFSTSKVLKQTFVKQLQVLSAPFTEETLQTLIREKVSLFTLLDLENIKKTKTGSVDALVKEMVEIAGQIRPALDKLRDTRHTFLHLASWCKQAIENDPHSYKHYSPDQLVFSMVRAIDDPVFVESVASGFNVAIIDEFQDTDASQWKIFSTLFSKRRAKAFFLVGDPKQSIYSFRKADLSIFYAAKKQMDRVACLDTNYRSSAPLQTNLNALFSTRPSWLDTPTLALPYHRVKIAPDADQKGVGDGKQAIHFALFNASSATKKTWPTLPFETEVLFPFIAKEILEMSQNFGIELSKIAVLVKDRFSRQRLASYLAQCSIPYRMQRGSSLFDGPAFDFFSHLVLAIIEKGEKGSIEAITTHPFMCEQGARDKKFNFTYLEWKTHLVQAYHWWKTKNFSRAIAWLMSENINSYHSLTTLFKDRGWEHYHTQLLNIIDQFYLAFREKTYCMTSMKKFIISESFHFLTLQQVEKVRASGQGVELMTTFMSKGLEFDVVLPLALLYRHGAKSNFVRIKGETVPFDKESIEHQNVLSSQRAERLRQLYVAMTRAKKRLYIPYIVDEHLDKVPL
ncbi:hypothetical protein COB21_03720, partial [Candidatus Aerophobetes bacterium]